MNETGEVKPRSLRFTWSMKTTSSRDPNEIMAEIKKVSLGRKSFHLKLPSFKKAADAVALSVKRPGLRSLKKRCN